MYNTLITFIVHFKPPTQGMGFDVDFDHRWGGGQRGCSGIDANGDGIAECDGASGMLPSRTTVKVTFNTSAGKCVASYSTP